MVVCKFFLQGCCRFGQNCRFEHIYDSKYSYHANQSRQAPVQPTSTEYTDEQLLNQVQADIQLALRGGQWILSCYSPFKEQAIYPGIHDLSPEEARLFIYEAKNSNNIEQAVNYMNELFKETRQKYEQLLQPSVENIKLLRSIYKGERVTFSNASQNTFSSSNNAASSLFRSAVQNQPSQNNTGVSIFSQGQPNIFNSQPDQAKTFSNVNNGSIFSQNPAPVNSLVSSNQNNTAKSIFANAGNQFNETGQTDPSSLFSTANQNIFGPNQNNSPFTQTQNSPFTQTQNSPFTQTQNSPFTQTQNSPFTQTQNSPFTQTQNSPFSQTANTSPFSQTQNTSPFSQANVFQNTESPASIFSQANSQLTSAGDSGIYSTIEELSQEDLEVFKADHFVLGYVPELPPPQQLCTRAL